MKKYASLLLFALILNGCDDGDLTIDEINFDQITPVSCPSTSTDATTATGNTLIYQLKEQEALLLQMPAKAGTINNDTVYKYNINTTDYRVVYRAYDGKVVSNNLCSTIPPSTPNVTEEWLAASGVINITSVAIPTAGPNEGSTRISGYSHTIDFTNITFNRSNGVPETFLTYPFGNAESKTAYTTTVTPADLTFENSNQTVVFAYQTGNQVYNFNSSFYLMIDNIDPDLLSKVETPAGGQPKTFLVTTRGKGYNNVIYKKVTPGTGSITADYFNQSTVPVSPTFSETWNGVDGEANVSGIIEVTTTKTADIYYHKIIFKSVALKKGGSKFQLGNSFLLGTVTTK